MRRRHVHALFAGTALTLAVLAGAQALQLQRAVRADAALAQAFARANAAPYDEAVAAYKALAHGGRGEVERAALFNLGNRHLREARRSEPSDSARKQALVELAKQSYRALLRLDPADWEARYNLERALWMAPEDDEPAEELAAPEQSERAVTTMKSDRGALP